MRYRMSPQLPFLDFARYEIHSCVRTLHLLPGTAAWALACLAFY